MKKAPFPAAFDNARCRRIITERYMVQQPGHRIIGAALQPWNIQSGVRLPGSRFRISTLSRWTLGVE